MTTADEIQEMQRATREVYVDDLIKQYIVTIISATRDHADIALGASPRGSLFLYRGAQALALIRGRDYALPDDVKELIVPIMRHRIIISAAARMRGCRSRKCHERNFRQHSCAGSTGTGLVEELISFSRQRLTCWGGSIS